jgi:hypothetical protein
VGEPIFNLYGALSAYRNGLKDKARIRLIETMISNLYILPKIVGKSTDVENIWHSSNREQKGYLQEVDEFLGEPTEDERTWILSELNSDEFSAFRNGYISTYPLLNDERDIIKRIKIIAAWDDFRAKQFERLLKWP